MTENPTSNNFGLVVSELKTANNNIVELPNKLSEKLNSHSVVIGSTILSSMEKLTANVITGIGGALKSSLEFLGLDNLAGFIKNALHFMNPMTYIHAIGDLVSNTIDRVKAALNPMTYVNMIKDAFAPMISSIISTMGKALSFIGKMGSMLLTPIKMFGGALGSLFGVNKDKNIREIKNLVASIDEILKKQNELSKSINTGIDDQNAKLLDIKFSVLHALLQFQKITSDNHSRFSRNLFSLYEVLEDIRSSLENQNKTSLRDLETQNKLRQLADKQHTELLEAQEESTEQLSEVMVDQLSKEISKQVGRAVADAIKPGITKAISKVIQLLLIVSAGFRKTVSEFIGRQLESFIKYIERRNMEQGQANGDLLNGLREMRRWFETTTEDQEIQEANVDSDTALLRCCIKVRTTLEKSYDEQKSISTTINKIYELLKSGDVVQRQRIENTIIDQSDQTDAIDNISSGISVLPAQLAERLRSFLPSQTELAENALEQSNVLSNNFKKIIGSLTGIKKEILAGNVRGALTEGKGLLGQGLGALGKIPKGALLRAGGLGVSAIGAGVGMGGIMDIARDKENAGAGAWLRAAGGGAATGAGIGMMFGPVGAAIGAGIGGLVGIIGGLIARYGDEIKAWFGEMKEKFMAGLNKVWTFFKDKVYAIFTAGVEGWKDGGLFGMIKGVFKEAYGDLIKLIKDKSSEWWNSIVGKIGEGVEKFKQKIQDIWDSIKDSALGLLPDWVQKLVGDEEAKAQAKTIKELEQSGIIKDTKMFGEEWALADGAKATAMTTAQLKALSNQDNLSTNTRRMIDEELAKRQKLSQLDTSKATVLPRDFDSSITPQQRMLAQEALDRAATEAATTQAPFISQPSTITVVSPQTNTAVYTNRNNDPFRNTRSSVGMNN